MRTLSDIPAYNLLGDRGNVASGNPFSYYVVERISGVFIYEPTPAIVGAFVNESDAETFIKAATGGCKSYSIYCSRSHYGFFSDKLPDLREKYKDRLIP